MNLNLFIPKVELVGNRLEVTATEILARPCLLDRKDLFLQRRRCFVNLNLSVHMSRNI